MQESARPENHEWARRMVRPFVRQLPSFRGDIESEALHGLVRAERHPSCPGPEQFQQFAHSFVVRAATDEVRRIRRQNRKFGLLEHADLLPGREDVSGSLEWSEMRLKFAEHLAGGKRRIFLRVYGENVYRTLQEAASDLGISLSQAKRWHVAALEALRDLPGFYQVA